MLINIFGIWLMVSNISHLRADVGLMKLTDGNCGISMNSGRLIDTKLADCDEAAVIINKQIKEQSND